MTLAMGNSPFDSMRQPNMKLLLLIVCFMLSFCFTEPSQPKEDKPPYDLVIKYGTNREDERQFLVSEYALINDDHETHLVSLC